MANKIAVLIPCYKRPEYTARCLQHLLAAQEYPNADFFLIDDASCDATEHLLHKAPLPNKAVWVHGQHEGLRHTILDFFKVVLQNKNYDFIVKLDSDCLVPKNWLNEVVRFLETGWADIVSPNVMPSNAAFKHGGEPEEGKPGLRPSKIVGGLWAMRASLLEGIQFEEIPARGLTGAFSLLEQIIVEKEPRVGWLPDVIVQDVGHWSGQHPDHIRSEEHREYSVEVGRRIAW